MRHNAMKLEQSIRRESGQKPKAKTLRTKPKQRQISFPPKLPKKRGFARLLAELAAPTAMRHHTKTPAAMIAGICGPQPAAAPDRAAAAVTLGYAVTLSGGGVMGFAESRLAGRKEADTHRGGPSKAI